MKDFQDRVAVVTGGASGIGKALSKAFLAAGAKVVISDVEVSALDATCAELKTEGDITGIVTDVRDPESTKALADAVYSQHGACHVLCNNAGVSVPNLNCWETEAKQTQRSSSLKKRRNWQI